MLAAGGLFHTTKGAVRHDELIARPDGVVVTSAGGTPFLALRPLLNEFTVTMPRGAAVVYPKDAARILVDADIFPGARVVEAGAGSGALTCYLLRAVGEHGRLTSFERREDFAAVARRNVEGFFSGPHPAWQLRADDLVAGLSDEPVDRAVLDLLAPWDYIDPLAEVLVPGGVLAADVTTTTQLGRLVETLRAHGGFNEPERPSRWSAAGTPRGSPYGHGTTW